MKRRSRPPRPATRRTKTPLTLAAVLLLALLILFISRFGPLSSATPAAGRLTTHASAAPTSVAPASEAPAAPASPITPKRQASAPYRSPEQARRDLAAFFPQTPVGELELSWLVEVLIRDGSAERTAKLWDELRARAADAAETIGIAQDAFTRIPDRRAQARSQLLSLVLELAPEPGRLDLIRKLLEREGRKDYVRGRHYDVLDHAPLLTGLAFYLSHEPDRARRASLVDEISETQSDPAVLDRLDELADRWVDQESELQRY